MSKIDFKNINKSWTLFLDRDGVINVENHPFYINKWEEFKFYGGVLEAMKIFSQHFGKIFIVTNQRGIAKGVTKLEDLELIHNNLTKAVKEAGGHIDQIYYCADFDLNSPNRKPNPGMGLQAKKDFPSVDFTKSIMVGNTLSDMQFGRNLDLAATVFLQTNRPEVDVNDPAIDFHFPDLITFAIAMSNSL